MNNTSQEEVFNFITIFGLAVFIGLCIFLIVLIATSLIILIIYLIIECLLRPFLGTCLDTDLEIGQHRNQRSRIMTYQYHTIIPTNLRLSNERRNKTNRGLRQSVIESILPRLLVGEGNEENEDECTICLSGYEKNEECRVFPVCRHMYHVKCIDLWLKNHITCPTCRTDLSGS